MIITITEETTTDSNLRTSFNIPFPTIYATIEDITIINPVGSINLLVYSIYEKGITDFSITSLMICATINTILDMINAISGSQSILKAMYTIGNDNNAKPSTSTWYFFTTPAAWTIVVIGLPILNMAIFMSNSLEKDTIYCSTPPNHNARRYSIS